MALVAYGDSDMSDYEDEEETLVLKNDNVDKAKEIEILTKPAENTPSQSRLNLPAPKSALVDTEHDIFSKLPQPKENLSTAIVEEEDEFLKKKEKPEIKPPPPVKCRKPVKIQLAALTDFQDEDTPEANLPQILPTVKPSGLLGMLPPPKQIICSSKAKRTMVPHVLTKKPLLKPTQTQSSSKSLPIKKTPPKSLINYDSSDESDSEMPTDKQGDKSSSDFFSLNDDYKLPEISYDDLNIKPAESKFKSVQPDSEIETYIMDVNSYVDDSNEDEQENGELQLDDEALRQLCGSRAKRYKPENIQIIDMSHKDVLPNEEEWMREALQEATAGPRSLGVKALGGPSSTQKRKHQITYLAHQAKANELELQNQWAANRQTRRQTQSKYGF